MAITRTAAPGRSLVLNSPRCQFTGKPWSVCRCRGCIALNARRRDDDEECPDCGSTDNIDGVCQDCGTVLEPVENSDDDGAAASRAAAFASIRADPYDTTAKRHCIDALQCAAGGDSKGAAAIHLKAAKRLRAKADAATDPNSDVGGKGVIDKGLSVKFRKAARAHEEAAAVHANEVQGTVGGEQDAGDDAATANRRAKLNDMGRRLQERHRLAVRNSQRRNAPLWFNGGCVCVGDVLETGRPSMRSIVANQRRSENKGFARNYADGGNSPYPQYDLATGPFARGRMLQGVPGGMHSFDTSDLDTAGMMAGPTEPNRGRSGRAGASADGSGGETGDQYDADDYWTGMKYVTGGDGKGMSGAQALGILMLDPGEQATVDAEMARRLGLDYSPDDAFQLATPRTMAELLDREYRQGHSQQLRSGGGGSQPIRGGIDRGQTRNAALLALAAGCDPDVMVLNGFDPREAQALQRGFDRGGRRRR